MKLDIRNVELQKREGNFAGILGAILVIVVGAVLCMAGAYAIFVADDSIPRAGRSAEDNSTLDSIKAAGLGAMTVLGGALSIGGVVVLVQMVRGMAS